MPLQRIGIFHTTLPEPGRKPGGVDVFVDRLAQRLNERGHSVRCFSYSPRPEGADYEHVQLAPRRMGAWERLVRVPLRLNSLDTGGLDVLHLHGDDWFFVRRRVPTVRTFHGSAFSEALHATSARRRVGQLAVAPGELAASRLATLSYGVSPGHPKGFALDGTLPNGVDVPASVPDERPGPPSILFIGTWDGRKRGRLLHQVFRTEVRTRVPDARLWMVSDRCEDAPGVEWLERPSDAEIGELLERAWAFCMPSTYEGFGIPYVEAMAAGVPVVASDNVGARYVLDDGRVGRIVPDDGLGGALRELLTDQVLRRRMRAEQRRWVERFGWGRVLDEHERAYSEAQARFGSRRSAAPRIAA